MDQKKVERKLFELTHFHNVLFFADRQILKLQFYATTV